MGQSGSGKSTLLSCILGLVRPDAGTILVHGQTVRAGLSGRMARLRRERIGMVFQMGELLPELSPIGDVMIAGLLSGQATSEARDRSEHLLAELGVPEGTRSVGEFSAANSSVSPWRAR